MSATLLATPAGLFVNNPEPGFAYFLSNSGSGRVDIEPLPV
jgi:hypothetical protein